MNIFDLIAKDLETLRKERSEAMAYAEAMTKAQLEYTDKICEICDRYGVQRKHGVHGALNSITRQLLDGHFDKEAPKC